MKNVEVHAGIDAETTASPAAWRQSDDAAAEKDGTRPPRDDCNIMLFEACGITDARDQERLARDYAHAISLYNENEHIFDYLACEIRKRANTGVQIKADEVAAFIREHDIADSHGEMFKVNHNYVPVFIREMVKKHPDLKPHIKLRKSRFDAFYADSDAKANDGLGR